MTATLEKDENQKPKQEIRCKPPSSLITELACFPDRPFATPDQPFVGALVVLRAFNPTSIPLSHEDDRAEAMY
jgi:hypothetical protein